MTKLEEAIQRLAAAVETAEKAAKFAPVMQYRLLNPMDRVYIFRVRI